MPRSFSNMKTFIQFRTQVVGFHNWPAAPSEVAYLRSHHRHVFHVIVEMPVAHADRDIEINLATGKLAKFLQTWTHVTDEPGAVDFGSLSCEQLAGQVAKALGKPCRVTVLEDGVAGGGVDGTEETSSDPPNKSATARRP